MSLEIIGLHEEIKIQDCWYTEFPQLSHLITLESSDLMLFS